MKRAQDTNPTGLAEPEWAESLGDAVQDRGGPARSGAAGPSWVPQRADGVTLIGEFEQSGFEHPPSLVRRKDGQVVQLTELLYITLEAVDGRR
ncbi:MAG TPA: hypothetical protein VG078_06575, partial [Acidimicrobiales bacterium]|nr:hypothetical protein [Acidimicrobiales bacterium]